MGEISFVPPATIRAARSAATPEEGWASLRDAVSEVAETTSETHLDLAISASGQWLWWFATDAAGLWEWSERAKTAIKAAGGGAAALDVALAMNPVEQAVWPSGVPSPEDCGLVRKLKPAQRRDLARMVRLGGGANFSVPGAGKTTMALTAWAVLRRTKQIDRCVVIAPLSAHEAWRTEAVEIFELSARPDLRERPRYLGGDIVVLNYEWLEAPENLDALRQWVSTVPTMAIFDEAHRAKAGRSGVRGAAARDLAHASPFRMVLTGTPRPNSTADLVNVLDLAYPGRGHALTANPTTLRSAYCRITKSELGLPPLVPRTERPPMSAAHDRVYDSMVDAAARATIADPSLAHDVERAGRIVMLLLQAATDPTAVLPVVGELHMTGDRSDLHLEELIRSLPASFVPTKFVRAVQLVDEHVAAGRKVVLWACFHSHVERLRRLLAPYRPSVVTGRTPVRASSAPTDRERELARFRNDPDCGVLIATPHTLGEGVSLHQTTTHQIHLDRTYNAGLFLQSLDRTHRLGLAADAHCTATFLVAQRRDGSRTVDGLVAGRLEAKVAAMSTALDDPNLVRLALPDLDDTLSERDVLLGDCTSGDLADLFGHLIADRNRTPSEP